jgi:hypothetical protein
MTALNQSVLNATVVIPERLTNATRISTALHLAVCGPQINWSLGNEALVAFAFHTTTDTAQDIQSKRLFVKSIWESENFIFDMVSILRIDDGQISSSLESLNKVIGRHTDLICSPLLFDTLVKVLLRLKSPAAVQKEKLQVVWIAKHQSHQIDDDSTRLINDYLFSPKEMSNIASLIVEIFYNLGRRGENKTTICTATDLPEALMTTITNITNDRNICYHGCEVVHYLTVNKVNKTERRKLLNAGMLNALMKVKEAHISDQYINSLHGKIIKFNTKIKSIGGPFDSPGYNFFISLVIVLPYFFPFKIVYNDLELMRAPFYFMRKDIIIILLMCLRMRLNFLNCRKVLDQTEVFKAEDIYFKCEKDNSSIINHFLVTVIFYCAMIIFGANLRFMYINCNPSKYLGGGELDCRKSCYNVVYIPFNIQIFLYIFLSYDRFKMEVERIRSLE